MGDAILLARRHRPVVALITERFWTQSALVAGSLGLADVPRVRLPYPIAGTGTAAIDDAAASAVGAVVAALGL